MLRSANWASWLDASWVQSLVQPDPVAETAIQQHLRAMAAMGLPTTEQGVWLQSGNQVLAEHSGKTALSAASLTKVATTLVALTTWGSNHQFETLMSTTGSIEAGIVQGDLLVQGGGDPLFVWEEAIVLGNALNQAGIRQVTGNLVITGNFAMNFETDPVTAGNLLKESLDASLWSVETEAQYLKLPSGTPRPRVNIQGEVKPLPWGTVDLTAKPIIRHQSLPLADILKAMNIYSNNPMAEMLANSLGGGAAVARKAAELAQVPPEEIQLINGSGLGMQNRITPRAVSAMLVATQRYLQPRQLNVADLYPVIGRDGGTLEGRQIPQTSAVKTGTLNEVSALAGVLPTRDRGLVWFSIINIGAGDIGTFHQQQDILLQKLQQAWGAASPLPPSIKPSDRSLSEPTRLGAASRNQALEQG